MARNTPNPRPRPKDRCAPATARAAAGTTSNLRQYLEQEFRRRLARNPRYSLRSFARDLDFDPAALSRILAGKRAISVSAAQRLLSRLKVGSTTREALLRSLVSPGDHGVPLDSQYHHVTEEQLEQIGDWKFSALLELARSRTLGLDALYVSRYFGISVSEAETRLKKLVALGLLRKTESGFRKAHERTSGSLHKSSPVLRKIKSGYIQRSLEALANHPDGSQDFSGITLLVSREKLPEASRRIKEFRRSLAHFLAIDRGEALYRLNVELFPLRSPPS